MGLADGGDGERNHHRRMDFRLEQDREGQPRERSLRPRNDQLFGVSPPRDPARLYGETAMAPLVLPWLLEALGHDCGHIARERRASLLRRTARNQARALPERSRQNGSPLAYSACCQPLVASVA